MWTPVGWDTLLNFDGPSVVKDEEDPFSIFDPTPIAGPSMSRVQSDPGSGNASSNSRGMSGAGPVSLEAGKLAQYGDLAWKTILASQVEVESVGQVGVAKVLQEVWRRGGGDQVSCTHRISFLETASLISGHSTIPLVKHHRQPLPATNGITWVPITDTPDPCSPGSAEPVQPHTAALGA